MSATPPATEGELQMKYETVYAEPVTIRQSWCRALERWEWEAVTVGVITTTHGGGYSSPEYAEQVIRNMMAAGMMAEREIVVTR